MNIVPPFGIDLGTTRTAAAVFLPDASEPAIARDDEGRPTLPSVVRRDGENRWLTGHRALEGGEPGTSKPVESVKRLMGTGEAIEEAGDLLPEDVSGIILSAISGRMQSHLSSSTPDLELEGRDAVITVPAYFDAPQIEATRRAGEAAGLQVAGLLQEPTAAAIYHSWRLELGDGTFLVYDLGGGTFDVSLIRAVYGEYQVLSIDGDNHLGGDDFDRRLADLIISRLEERGDLDVENGAHDEIFEALLRAARDAKEQLSERKRVDIRKSGLAVNQSGESVDVDTTVTREEFESAIADLIDSTMLATRRAIDTAVDRHQLEPDEIDGIFLVGGSTRVPAIRRTLDETFTAELDIDSERIIGDEPETSVARGAALQAAAIAPCRFETENMIISLTDFPSDNPDRHLIGDVEYNGEPQPTDVAFGVGDSTERRTALEGRETPFRFSISEFDAREFAPDDDFLVSTALIADDEPIDATFELWIPNRPEDSIPAPTLALSNPAVLAKDVNVEVVADGEPTRHTLLERGTHLPTTADAELFTGDETGALVLRLFQHRLPIHTVTIELPDGTPPGTPVELTVDVDQSMNLTARGSVRGESFEARIRRPSTPKHKSWDEIETLLDRADDIGGSLWGMESRRFSRELENLRAGIRAAARHDSRRLQVLARRLEELVDDYAPRPNRTPGRGRIDSLLDAIRRIVFAADEEILGHSQSEWRQRLEELADDVDSAWRGDDDDRWQSVADRVQATYESVAQDEFMFRRRDPEHYARTLLDATSARLQSISQGARDFPYSSDDEARKMQRAEIERIVESLESLQHRLPTAAGPDDISTLKSLSESAGHLQRRLERVHTLGVPRKGES